MATTGFVWHPASGEHCTGAGHPERPERIEAIRSELKRSGLWEELAHHEPHAAELASVEAVHDLAYLERTRAACARGPAHLGAGDTVVSPGSWKAALLSAGGLLEAVDQVIAGSWDNAFVAARPPGHHAERDREMGFCLINNVAVAAAHLRSVHGLERVAIVDWDVHHGNGTQHSFEGDAQVFYASLHQWPLYPGTGSARERGQGDGQGTTLNCPLPPGSTGREWLNSMEREVLPALEDFDPDCVLISAGFDAHADDPLAAVELGTDDYRSMSERLLELARARCGGRLISVLEGGYDLPALAASVRVHIEALRTASA